jgi:catechol 2,3-dioxygenase-like lactoylglutathione lyase family enzyme
VSSPGSATRAPATRPSARGRGRSRDEQNETLGLRLPGDGALLVLEVDDVDAEAERLGEHVVAGPVDRPDWGGRVAYLRDPSGNPIELFQAIPMER